MDASKVHETARKLFDAHGNRALAEAAQKATRLEDSGQKGQAKDWRRIETALKELIGPRES